MGWRHIGIVPMDRTQALATLSAPGIAVRGAPRLAGRFPVIVVLGGQYYLSTTAVRHHDLSDLGRPVTAPIAIRGESLAQVQQAYADVQDMTVRFFRAHSGNRDREDVDGYLRARGPARSFSVASYVAVAPAPTVEAILAALTAQTAATLADAHRRDPDATVFRADNLGRIIVKALATRQFAIAESVAEFALSVHPGTVPFLDPRSEAREGRGDRGGAAETGGDVCRIACWRCLAGERCDRAMPRAPRSFARRQVRGQRKPQPLRPDL